MSTRRGRQRPEFNWHAAWQDHRPFWVLFFIAVVCGGGGRGSTIANLMVQLSSLTVAWFARDRILAGWNALSWPLRLLVVATFLVPLLHLVPLPPTLWQSLPGRDILEQSYDAIDLQDSWAPISLTPGITALALTGLFAPVIMLLLATGLGKHSQRLVLLAIGLCALVNVGFGTIQLLSENRVGNLYGSRVPEYLYGTFIGHNASGLFFVIATMAMVEWIFSARPRGAAAMLAAGTALLFVIATLLTQSRAAAILLAIPAFLTVYHTFTRRKNDQRAAASRGGFVTMCLAVAVLGVGTVFVVQGAGRISQTLERFDYDGSNRLELWADAYVAAERYWPVGSGVGTFDEVFQLDESLETLVRLKAGRAHSEYLEIAIDSGLVGTTLLFLWLAYLGAKLVRGPDPAGVSRVFIGGIFVAFALHSALDFPLRNQAMLCITGLLLGLLNGPGIQDRKRSDVSSDN